ncbi:hypothetical protein TRFO_42551 [Tritrichomonas foetus]|uniref:Uncharacterized protein n=1 Tax=Tritrichomonas foetus TaxID=1144522 RepID=A0A1J4KW40_9EUKA|nr:hypothetical protein TRFO_42551 [Tritrichomonas foetus]|eukprot:OHT15354.1 hypothetical protein TRFO_42551 [Tritrichomonas foetus]
MSENEISLKESSQHQPTITVRHKNESYQIIEPKMRSKSILYATLFPKPPFFPITLDSKFSIDSVQKFIQFLNSDEIEITKNIAFEILALADTWNCVDLMEKCKSSILTYNPEFILQNYQFFLSHNLNFESAENIISTNLQMYLKTNIFLNLPIFVIKRLIQLSNPSLSQSELVDFCAHLIKARGNEGLEIFSLINFKKASFESITNLSDELDNVDQTQKIQMCSYIHELQMNNEKETNNMWKLLHQAVTSNKDSPRLAVAKMLCAGTHLTKNVQEAMSLFGQLSKNKNAEAQFFYSQYIKESDPKESLKLLTSAADQHFVPAIITLSDMYIKGKILMKPRQTFKYIEKAAIFGNSKAEFALGCFYRDGFYVKQDHDIALDYFSLSATHNNVNGLIEFFKLNSSRDNRLFFRLVETGNIELINKYIEYDRTVVNCINFENWTVAHYAVMPQGSHVISHLWNYYHINLNIPNISGAKPIHIACLYGNIEATKFLLKNGCNINEESYMHELPIHFACKSGNFELVKFLVNNYEIDLTKKTTSQWTCLHYASESGSRKTVQYLLKYIDLNVLTEDRETPLHLACKSGNDDLVRYLLKLPNIKINVLTVQKASIFHYACLSGDLNLVTKILALDEKFLTGKTVMKVTSLHFTCLSGNLSLVEYLVKTKKMSLHAKSDFGENALHFACKSGNERLVHYLMQISELDIGQQNVSFHIFILFFFICLILFLINHYGVFLLNL